MSYGLVYGIETNSFPWFIRAVDIVKFGLDSIDFIHRIPEGLSPN